MRKELISLLLAITSPQIFAIEYSADYLLDPLTQLNGFANTSSEKHIAANGNIGWIGNLDWISNPQPIESNDVFIYEFATGVVINLTNTVDNERNLDMNDNGDMVWIREESSGDVLVYYNSQSGTVSDITLIADYYKTTKPKINNNGYIVWSSIQSNTDNFSTYYTSEVWSYNTTSGEIFNITMENFPVNVPPISIPVFPPPVHGVKDNKPDINDNNRVVFTAWPEGLIATSPTPNVFPTEPAIFVYDLNNNYLELISDIADERLAPQINNRDEVVWLNLLTSSLVLYDSLINGVIYEIPYFLVTQEQMDPPPPAPFLGDNGDLIWAEFFSLMRMDAMTGVISNLGDVTDGYDMNSAGDIIWTGTTPTTFGAELLLYTAEDGVTHQILYPNGSVTAQFSGIKPKINASRQAVWQTLPSSYFNGTALVEHSHSPLIIGEPIVVVPPIELTINKVKFKSHKNKLKLKLAYEFAKQFELDDEVKILINGESVFSALFAQFKAEEDGEYELEQNGTEVEIDTTEQLLKLKYQFSTTPVENLELEVRFGDFSGSIVIPLTI